MSRSVAASAWFVLLLAVGCNGFVGEVKLAAPASNAAGVVDPDYLVLRPVSANADRGPATATVYESPLYYDPADRIMDLRHFDGSTATVEEPAPGNYLVSIRTTPEGDRLLGAWTAANRGRQLGIFVDGQLISAPRIETEITRMIVLENDFTKSQAEAIVARLQGR